jgi:phage terminase Nu1 subunit (DNA packaging protein)
MFVPMEPNWSMTYLRAPSPRAVKSITDEIPMDMERSIKNVLVEECDKARKLN